MESLDQLTAILNPEKSKGKEKVTGCSQSASMVNTHPPHARFTSIAPPSDPLDGNELGMKSITIDIDNDGSEFLSWFNGKGPFVPLRFTPDSIPKPVITSDPFHGLTEELFENRSRSSQIGPRPSPVIAPINEVPLFRSVNNYFSSQCRERSKAPIVCGLQTRFDKALGFRKLFTDNSSTEKGTCISSNGLHSWLDKACGIMWVAVHGMDSICVATRNVELENVMKQRMLALELKAPQNELLDMFMQGIVYKVQGLADPMLDQNIKNKKSPNCMYASPIFSNMSNQWSIKKPLGVVSVIQGKGHEVSSAEYDEEKAVKFLEAEIKSNTSLTFNKTVQTAISALQHLFCKKMKANEIRVIVWKEDGDLVKELPSFAYRSVGEQVAGIRSR